MIAFNSIVAVHFCCYLSRSLFELTRKYVEWAAKWCSWWAWRVLVAKQLNGQFCKQIFFMFCKSSPDHIRIKCVVIVDIIIIIISRFVCSINWMHFGRATRGTFFYLPTKSFLLKAIRNLVPFLFNASVFKVKRKRYISLDSLHISHSKPSQCNDYMTHS